MPSVQYHHVPFNGEKEEEEVLFLFDDDDDDDDDQEQDTRPESPSPFSWPRAQSNDNLPHLPSTPPPYNSQSGSISPASSYLCTPQSASRIGSFVLVPACRRRRRGRFDRRDSSKAVNPFQEAQFAFATPADTSATMAGMDRIEVPDFGHMTATDLQTSQKSPVTSVMAGVEGNQNTQHETRQALPGSVDTAFLDPLPLTSSSVVSMPGSIEPLNMPAMMEQQQGIGGSSLSSTSSLFYDPMNRDLLPEPALSWFANLHPTAKDKVRYAPNEVLMVLLQYQPQILEAGSRLTDGPEWDEARVNHANRLAAERKRNEGKDPARLLAARKRKSHGPRRPEGHINRLSNKFMMFRQWCEHTGVSREYISQGDMSKIIGKIWQSTNVRIRDLWTTIYQSEARAFKERHRDYKYQPSKGVKGKAKAKRNVQLKYNSNDNQDREVMEILCELPLAPASSEGGWSDLTTMSPRSICSSTFMESSEFPAQDGMARPSTADSLESMDIHFANLFQTSALAREAEEAAAVNANLFDTTARTAWPLARSFSAINPLQNYDASVVPPPLMRSISTDATPTELSHAGHDLHPFLDSLNDADDLTTVEAKVYASLSEQFAAMTNPAANAAKQPRRRPNLHLALQQQQHQQIPTFADLDIPLSTARPRLSISSAASPPMTARFCGAQWHSAH